ncbi:hypothetical protein B0H15DRAFT_267405 [Mycena belliarum]|uniref:MYND-type domain-containing protein n=1 Tax=Mycena belliarum TaxID=1033014 RepID=A0AAD6U3T5_9AGAR|nr:hypothetical protein B0H15DRAFT_267405 [Mycena belliae]
MAHPVLWPRLFFYPIGNASAVCLTDSIPAEQSAHVLLLGCGDPRNILYTLHSDPPTKRPALDFTCCDIEPAVIARNVLLLTLIYDGHRSDRLWNMFYHIKIDQAALALIVSQSKKLQKLCIDLDTWQKSSYAEFLKFCSSYTLSQVLHCLELYVQSESYSLEKHKQMFTAFTREFELHNRPGQIHNTAIAAGPFSLNVVDMLWNHFQHYWTTGTLSRSPADIAAAVFVNPTLVHSESFTPSLVGDSCSLHYGTSPLQGFHLASAFLTSSTSSESSTEERLVTCARSQFESWSSAFQIAVASPQRRVKIRMLAGDALALCRTFSEPSAGTDCLYVSPWHAAELLLDGDMASAPTKFDVIDTSNIADWVGLLNILIAAAPLLNLRPTSILYTELKLGIEGNKASNLEELLCADIPTIALLLGIAPAGNISQYISTSRVHEIMMNAGSYRERIAWKISYLADIDNTVVPTFPDHNSLASLLFTVYKQMFAEETVAVIFNVGRKAQQIIHYHRGTFAALLRLVKSRVRTDWTAVMEDIFARLHSDKSLILGSNNYQEFCCQLFLRGVYTVEAFGPHRATFAPISRTIGPFKGWKEVPPVVCLVLMVPRSKILFLESKPYGSPMFNCHVRGKTFHNIFSCIQAVLGVASMQGSGSDGRVTIVGDPFGWAGTSPLVISLLIPALNLAYNSEPIKISLGLYPTPPLSVALKNTLGPELTIFTADVMDRSAVLISNNRPGRGPTAVIPSLIPVVPACTTEVSVGLRHSKIATLTARWETTVGEPRVELAGTTVDHKQISPCVMQVAVDNSHQKKLVYPFPVDGTQAKVRIARKSGWIEIEVPLRMSNVSTLVDFAITSGLTQHGGPVLWSIHRINLTTIPLIEGKACRGRIVKTVQVHCALTFSDREHNMGPNVCSSALIDVKRSITDLIFKVFESSGLRAVRLSDPQDGVYTVLYCNGVRMDLASHTFVVDVCVLPLTEDLIKGPLGRTIVELSSQGITIITPRDEVEAWKHLLVAFTERCRTWTHTSTCQYATLGRIPASVNIFEDPLCGCGKGIDLDGLSLDKRWKRLAPLMTRAAISPLFALAYMETIDRQIKTQLEKTNAAKKCAACQKPELANSRLLKCSVCRGVEYCGRKCQQGHWKEHKRVCNVK